MSFTWVHEGTCRRTTCSHVHVQDGSCLSDLQYVCLSQCHHSSLAVFFMLSSRHRREFVNKSMQRSGFAGGVDPLASVDILQGAPSLHGRVSRLNWLSAVWLCSRGDSCWLQTPHLQAFTNILPFSLSSRACQPVRDRDWLTACLRFDSTKCN